MAHISTVKLLVAWARWGQGQSIDYPSMSPMFGERALKTPLHGVGHIPPDVAEVEIAVCRLSYEDRETIIQRYARNLTFRQFAKHFGYSIWKASKKIRQAENEVERELSTIGVSATPLYI